MLLQVHNDTGKMEYAGELVDLTEAISRLPAGSIFFCSRLLFTKSSTMPMPCQVELFWHLWLSSTLSASHIGRLVMFCTSPVQLRRAQGNAEDRQQAFSGTNCVQEHEDCAGSCIGLYFLSQALMSTDASDVGGQILMSGMSFHRLSGRLHEIQNRTRAAGRKVPAPQVLSNKIPVDNEPPRESFERPGSTVIDMTSLRARYSQDSILQPKVQEVSSKPSKATAREEVAEGNAGASSAWLLAAKSFSGKEQPISCCFHYQ